MNNINILGGSYGKTDTEPSVRDEFSSDVESFYRNVKNYIEDDKEELESDLERYEEFDETFGELVDVIDTETDVFEDMVNKRIKNLAAAEKCTEVVGCMDEMIERYDEIIEDCETGVLVATLILMSSPRSVRSQKKSTISERNFARSTPSIRIS
ncbi:MAG: hypothetical protein ACLFQ8_03530 [Candidatus Aenigmatarchaeota archaeon]